MKEYNEFYSFITLYNLIIMNLTNRNKMHSISIYYLNNEFNINIKTMDTNEIIYNDHFNTSLEAYNYLVSVIGYSFIENHKINLPFFENINTNDSKLYYLSNDSINKPLDYDKAKVHILRNSKFQLKIYYFNGLNKSGYDMQDKALKKLKMS